MDDEVLRIDTNTMTDAERQLQSLLRQFVAGPNRSLAVANTIEEVVATHFDEDPRFDDLSHALACYSPFGGEYLYDERAMVHLCEVYLSCYK